MPPATCLVDSDPPPFVVEHADGASPYLLICDHAGREVPRMLHQLGLSDDDLRSHTAWDIGAAGLARRLACGLDAFLILQTYSRLVIDCNRPPLTASDVQARARQREIFDPYHDRIRAELDERVSRGQPALLVALHSFTPVLDGIARPWDAGVLYGRDARLGRVLLELLRAEDGLCVGENQPYDVSDETDYAIPVHGEGRGIPHVELEIRNDQIADSAGQAQWAARLAQMLKLALPRFVHQDETQHAD